MSTKRKAQASPCQKITFQQALGRILADEVDPKLQAEWDARAADPLQKLKTLEFTLGMDCLQAAELLRHETPEIRTRAAALLQAFSAVMSEVQAGTCPMDSAGILASFVVKQTRPSAPTVEIPRALALDLMRYLTVDDFLDRATEPELEAGIHYERFEAHRAWLDGMVNSIGDDLCEAGTPITAETMLTVLSMAYASREVTV